MLDTLERRTSIKVIQNVLIEISEDYSLHDFQRNHIQTSLAILDTDPDLLTQVSILLTAEYIRSKQDITLYKTANYDDLMIHIKRGEHRLVDWSRY